jgi:chemotaxis protein methyltransferase CheR
MLSDAHVAELARAARRRVGVALDPSKAQMYHLRLTPIARREGLTHPGELIEMGLMRPDDPAWDVMVDALLNAETSFFRDRAPFDVFAQAILPELAHKRGDGDKIRIWSAGCSTGQEAYSLAMLLHEAREEGRCGAFEVIATDISERLLDRARSGAYSQFEAQRGLSIRRLIRHFERAGETWRISDRLRASVRFINHNLLHDAGQLGMFDAIFCRNVLIAFDAETRADVLERLGEAAHNDAPLFLGADEDIAGGMRCFTPSRVHQGVFTRITGRAAAA